MPVHSTHLKLSHPDYLPDNVRICGSHQFYPGQWSAVAEWLDCYTTARKIAGSKHYTHVWAFSITLSVHQAFIKWVSH